MRSRAKLLMNGAAPLPGITFAWLYMLAEARSEPRNGMIGGLSPAIELA
jgi:hypothetical protein